MNALLMVNRDIIVPLNKNRHKFGGNEYVIGHLGSGFLWRYLYF